MRKELLLNFIINEFTDDEYDNELYNRAESLNRNTCCMFTSLRRDYVPKEPNYMGSVIREIRIPENIDDFRVDYRVTRHLFDILLEMTYNNLLVTGSGPDENVSPEKKLLVTLCYLANTQSMREVAHTFNLSMSTVNAIIRHTVDASVQHGGQVSSIC
ncbi:hypothetical protein DPMN_082409 [Dreissena polymorpha]|uniref:Transposase Helix-turn-helix domain-containing protein n=1 Tax=Dreissena polymorpha TaxID=45954 RepID=A0A9D3Y6W4_DREPO|nr:hypothetical protein DPMN_082408 [Dreissena polymorpha]KAH3694963.1 hypothetical protein DPMN_082409 [Dreissena polymorpha]